MAPACSKIRLGAICSKPRQLGDGILSGDVLPSDPALSAVLLTLICVLILASVALLYRLFARKLDRQPRRFRRFSTLTISLSTTARSAGHADAVAHGAGSVAQRTHGIATQDNSRDPHSAALQSRVDEAEESATIDRDTGAVDLHSTEEQDGGEGPGQIHDNVTEKDELPRYDDISVRHGDTGSGLRID